MIRHLLALPSLAALALALSACGSPEPSVCAPGGEGCPCSSASTCGDGLVCSSDSNVCLAPRSVSLPAIDPAARSCEVLLEDGTAHVVDAVFDSSVLGQSVRQAPRTAVTFFSASDAPIRSSAVRIQLAGDGVMTVRTARCFDRAGRPLAGGGIASGG